MEYATNYEKDEVRQAAVVSLAVVGFVTLVVAGILLAVYAARFVPETLSRISSYFNLAGVGETGGLAVVSSTTTLPFAVATSTEAIATTTVSAPASLSATTTKKTTKPAPIAGYYTATSSTPTAGSVAVAQTATPYGLSNLSVVITAVGAVDANGNVVAKDPIDSSDTLGATILVTNTGTNNSGDWGIKVTVPTTADRSFDYETTEPSLGPNQSTIITMRLTRGHPRTGDGQELSVIVDPDNHLTESNESDNEATKTFNVN